LRSRVPSKGRVAATLPSLDEPTFQRGWSATLTGSSSVCLGHSRCRASHGEGCARVELLRRRSFRREVSVRGASVSEPQNAWPHSGNREVSRWWVVDGSQSSRQGLVWGADASKRPLW
jgi:hypothetical protein